MRSDDDEARVTVARGVHDRLPDGRSLDRPGLRPESFRTCQRSPACGGVPLRRQLLTRLVDSGFCEVRAVINEQQRAGPVRALAAIELIGSGGDWRSPPWLTDSGGERT